MIGNEAQEPDDIMDGRAPRGMGRPAVPPASIA